MKKYFNKVFYRTASSIITTLTKGGSYPDWTFSGWTLLVGAQGSIKTGIEADGEEGVDGGATTYISGQKNPLEIEVKNFSTADYNTIMAAFLNKKVDVLLVDSDQISFGYAVFGTRLHPKLEVVSGEEPKITLSGDRKYGSEITTKPFQIITIS
jgi:hypothetical protein